MVNSCRNNNTFPVNNKELGISDPYTKFPISLGHSFLDYPPKLGLTLTAHIFRIL